MTLRQALGIASPEELDVSCHIESGLDPDELREVVEAGESCRDDQGEPTEEDLRRWMDLGSWATYRVSLDRLFEDGESLGLSLDREVLDALADVGKALERAGMTIETFDVDE